MIKPGNKENSFTKLFICDLAPKYNPRFIRKNLEIPATKGVNQGLSPTMAAPKPAPKASMAKANPKKIASLQVISPDPSKSALLGSFNIFITIPILGIFTSMSLNSNFSTQA